MSAAPPHRNAATPQRRGAPRDGRISTLQDPQASATGVHSQGPRPVTVGEFRGSSRYELLLKLASGGSASVYVGRVTGSAGFSRLVAVKRAHPHLAHDAAVQKMMRTEARLASSLNHANVVAVQDVEKVDSELLLILDYVEGASLSELLTAGVQTGNPLPTRVAMRIVLDAAIGLAAVHGIEGNDGRPVGFLHRDVSPQNILIGVDGTGRITDFGLAKHICSDASRGSGMLQGKLAYLAPEIIEKVAFTVQSDLFAMAVVLWEAMARRRLFQGDTWADTVRKVGLVQPPPLSRVIPGLDERIDRIVARALDKEPARRHPTVRAFVDELEAVGVERNLIATTSEVSAYMQSVVGDALQRRRALIRPFQPPVDLEELMTTQTFDHIPRASSLPPPPPAHTARASSLLPPPAQPPSAVPRPALPRANTPSGLLLPRATSPGALPRPVPPPRSLPRPQLPQARPLGPLPRTTPPPAPLHGHLGPLPRTTPPPALPNSASSPLPRTTPPPPMSAGAPALSRLLPPPPAVPRGLLKTLPVVPSLDGIDDDESTINRTPPSELPPVPRPPMPRDRQRAPVDLSLTTTGPAPYLAAPLPPEPPFPSERSSSFSSLSFTGRGLVESPSRLGLTEFTGRGLVESPSRLGLTDRTPSRSRSHAPPAVVSGSLLRRPLRHAGPPPEPPPPPANASYELDAEVDEEDQKPTSVQQSPWATPSSDPFAPWVPPSLPPEGMVPAKRGGRGALLGSIVGMVVASVAMAAVYGPVDMRSLPAWAASRLAGAPVAAAERSASAAEGARVTAGQPTTAPSVADHLASAQPTAAQPASTGKSASSAGASSTTSKPEGAPASAVASSAPAAPLTPEMLPDATTKKASPSAPSGQPLTPADLPDVKRNR
ncbi:uncharacterized protein CMC5_061600 [Chondromyces crocatus]|uniref:Protein kinase domain-containing protein n=2 Tax=Chondromyces crocatus TaxID=52 RepID=A0A0K1EMS7_CHOCO|nr:uncharacterized protein CMC5_061600 [Chondromyces crocatus]